MRLSYSLLPILLLTLIACSKDEPFEYPENPEDVEPAWYTISERTVTAEEDWVPVQMTDGCDPSLHINNVAFYELNYKRGFASIQLVPDSSICEASVRLTTAMDASVAEEYNWNNMKFEYTFAEYEGNDNTTYRVTLHYGTLAFSVDLGPTLEELIPADENNGLLSVFMENGAPVFTLNGTRFNPQFGEGSENYLITDYDGDDAQFALEMHTIGSSQLSYTLFKYLRIQRYGNPPS